MQAISQRKIIMQHQYEKFCLLKAVSATKTAFRISGQIVMTKSFKKAYDGQWVENTSAAKAYLNYAQEFLVKNINDVFSILKKGANDPSIYAIRGHLVEGIKSDQKIRRLLHDNGNDKATISYSKSKLIFWDGDSFLLPENINPLDIDAVVHFALSLMPSILQNVSCVWQITSGHGIKPGGRVRLCFFSDIAVGPDQLKILFKNCPGTDHAVFYPAQPIYIANPIFIDGNDFIAERFGIIKGKKEFAPLSDFDFCDEAPILSSHSFIYDARSTEDLFEYIGDPPYYPNGLGFHRPVMQVIGRLARNYGPEFFSNNFVDTFSAKIANRARECGRPENYITHRLNDLKRFIQFVSAKEMAKKIAPKPENYNRPTYTIEEARKNLSNELHNFFTHAAKQIVARQRFAAYQAGAINVPKPFLDNIAPQGEVVLINSELGLGKTEETIKLIHDLLDGHFYEEGNKPLLPIKIEVLVKDHALANEFAHRVNKIKAGTAVVWKGIEYNDHSGGEAMCSRPKDLSLWSKAGGNIKTLCRNCPFGKNFQNSCSYNSQDKSPPVIIVASPKGLTGHPLTGFNRTLKMPGMEKSIRLGPDLTIVDETNFQSWLGGFDNETTSIFLNLFQNNFRHPKLSINWSTEDWWYFETKIHSIKSLLIFFNEQNGTEQSSEINFGHLRNIFNTAQEWNNFRKLILSLKIELRNDLASLSNFSEVSDFKQISAWNTRIFKIARLCFVVSQALNSIDDSGNSFPDQTACHLIKIIHSNEFGIGFSLFWRAEIPQQRSGISTLILDATADKKILGNWVPNLKTIERQAVILPKYVSCIQVSDNIVGYSNWIPSSHHLKFKSQQNKIKKNNEKLLHLIDVLSAAAPKNGLAIILPKRLEAAIENFWSNRTVGRPNNIYIAHFNKIAGLDFMKNVDVLLLWSRPSPPPNAVETITSAVFNKPVRPLAGWYENGNGTYIMRDGTYKLAEKAEKHPDPIVELVRAQIVDGELLQAIARSRYIRRSEINPLLIIIGTAIPTSLEVDQLVNIKDLLTFGPIEALAARGVIIPSGAKNKGYASLLSLATGMTVQSVKDNISSLNVENCFIGYIKKNSDVEEQKNAAMIDFAVKISGDARYWTTVRLRHELANNPRDALIREGINVFDIKRLSFKGENQIITVSMVSVRELPEHDRIEIERAILIFETFANIQSGLVSISNDCNLHHALSSSRHFIREWTTEAITWGWSAEDIFGKSGLLQWMGKEKLRSFGPEHAITISGRVFDRLAA